MFIVFCHGLGNDGTGIKDGVCSHAIQLPPKITPIPCSGYGQDYECPGTMKCCYLIWTMPEEYYCVLPG